MPDFPIVDTHVHLIDRERLDYPWLQNVPAIDRDATLADYDGACGAVDVAAMVFVEVAVAPGQALAEAKFVAGLGDPRLAAIVAHAPLERGAAVEADLAALAAIGPVRGVRRLLQGEADPEFCLRPAFLEGVRALRPFGFSFDICVTHRQIEAVVRFAERVPDVPLILDHIGKPAIAAGQMAPWADAIKALGAMEHVTLKLSGVATEANHDAWRPDDLMPFMEVAYGAFGPARTMFGSDWPVSTLAIGYERWVDLVDGFVGPADAPAVFGETARRVYRLA
ncbi:MAG: amidohydrolase family protein [Pseudomonadota bacterium]